MNSRNQSARIRTAMTMAVFLGCLSCEQFSFFPEPEPPKQDATSPDRLVRRDKTRSHSRLSAVGLITKPTVSEIKGYPPIPLVDHPMVERFERYYETTHQKSLDRSLTRREFHREELENIFRQHGLPIELVNIAVIESDFNLQANGTYGSRGVWQLVKQTARSYGLKVDGKVDERLDLIKSTHAVAKHFADLYDIYDDWYLAIAAYNAGVGSVNEAIKRGGSRDFFELAERKVLRPVTIDFVPRFIALSKLCREREAAREQLG